MANTYTGYAIYCFDEDGDLQRDIEIQATGQIEAKSIAKDKVKQMIDDYYPYERWSFELHWVMVNNDTGDIITDKKIEKIY